MPGGRLAKAFEMRRRDVAVLLLSLVSIYISLQHEGSFSFHRVGVGRRLDCCCFSREFQHALAVLMTMLDAVLQAWVHMTDPDLGLLTNSERLPSPVPVRIILPANIRATTLTAKEQP